MTNILNVITEDGQPYLYFANSSAYVRLRVKATTVCISLSMLPRSSNPMYEIFIGTPSVADDKTSVSSIRRNKETPDVVTVSTPDIISNTEFRSLWIRWDGHYITVGSGNDAVPFMVWEDPEPFPLRFFGVKTVGATGVWSIDDGPQFSTPGNADYEYRPFLSGLFEFEFLGTNDCSICLSHAPSDEDPMYEILIGCWFNTTSTIKNTRDGLYKVTACTPQILDPEDYRRFCIEWTCGKIQVKDSSGSIFMQWSDSNPFPITHVGIRTVNCSGQWRIKQLGK